MPRSVVRERTRVFGFLAIVPCRTPPATVGTERAPAEAASQGHSRARPLWQLSGLLGSGLRFRQHLLEAELAQCGVQAQHRIALGWLEGGYLRSGGQIGQAACMLAVQQA